MRAQIILDTENQHSIEGSKPKDRRENATNEYRLYGLHYNEVASMLSTPGSVHATPSIDQLHAQLIKERQNRT